MRSRNSEMYYNITISIPHMCLEFTHALCCLSCLQQADKAIAEEKLAAAKPALAEAEAALQVRKIWNWTLMLSTMSIHYQSCMWHIHAILSTHHPCRLSKLLTSPQFANWGNPHTSSCASWTVPCCCSRGSWIPWPWTPTNQVPSLRGESLKVAGGVYIHLCSLGWLLIQMICPMWSNH